LKIKQIFILSTDSINTKIGKKIPVKKELPRSKEIGHPVPPAPPKIENKTKICFKTELDLKKYCSSTGTTSTPLKTTTPPPTPTTTTPTPAPTCAVFQTATPSATVAPQVINVCTDPILSGNIMGFDAAAAAGDVLTYGWICGYLIELGNLYRSLIPYGGIVFADAPSTSYYVKLSGLSETHCQEISTDYHALCG